MGTIRRLWLGPRLYGVKMIFREIFVAIAV